jgi:hypothetical protein
VSTTFDVYPRKVALPSFNELLVLGEKRLHEQLQARYLHNRPVLTMELRQAESHELLDIDRNAAFRWDESAYLWLSFTGHAGGTDVYCDPVDAEEDLDHWAYILAPDNAASVTPADVTAAFPAGVYWSFQRSAGQPALINFAYGILAAALAELTDGLVYSDDSAWDFERFPARAEAMYAWYFVPEKAIDPGYRQWAHSCLDAIARECG